MRGGVLPPVDDPTHEVVVVPARGSDEAAHRTVQLVTDSIPRALGIAGDDIQVVTPVHRGAAGTAALNTALKAQLNPGTGTIGGFDVGDRVVATANHLDEGFANGEVGVVTAITEGQLVVSLRGLGAGLDPRRRAVRPACTAGRSPSTAPRARSGRRSSWCCRPRPAACCPARWSTPR